MTTIGGLSMEGRCSVEGGGILSRSSMNSLVAVRVVGAGVRVDSGRVLTSGGCSSVVYGVVAVESESGVVTIRVVGAKMRVHSSGVFRLCEHSYGASGQNNLKHKAII
jgi:hypothetical protein